MKFKLIKLFGSLLLALTLISCSTLREPETDKVSSTPTTVSTERTFANTKKYVYQLFKNHKESFYCGCQYQDKNNIDVTECGFEPKKRSIRSERTEIEHILPAKSFGGDLDCWKNKVCINNKGKNYGGRKCCNKINDKFNIIESDLFNLVPVIGELNLARGTKPYGIVEHHTYEFGKCEFFIDRENKIVEPRDKVKGTVARASLYMNYIYDLQISTEQVALFNKWDQQYPPQPWEIKWNKDILRIQGNSNKFIDKWG